MQSGVDQRVSVTAKAQAQHGKVQVIEAHLLPLRGMFTINSQPPGRPGGLSGFSVPLFILAQVMISQFVGSNPTLGSSLTARGLLGILSLFLHLSAPPALAVSK